MTRSIMKRICFLLQLFATLGLTDSVMACGFSWALPSAGIYDMVTAQGEFVYARQLDVISLGKNQLPVTVVFKPANPFSAILPAGWTLPLLDSKIVQKSENEFLFYQPNGWIRTFYRSAKNPSLLQGDGWQAVINGKEITAWAECGWRLIFHSGELISLKNGSNGELRVEKEGGRIVGLSDGNKRLVALKYGENNFCDIIQVGSNEYHLNKGRRPLITGNASETKQVSQIVNTIEGISKNGHTIASYKFSASDDLDSVLKIQEIGSIPVDVSWETNSAQAKMIDGWRYKVKIAAGTIKIERTKNGEVEFWSKEPSGIESRKANGETIISQVFTSGKLIGQLRKHSVFDDNGKLTSEGRYTYDENGTPIRSVLNGLTIEYKNGKPFTLQFPANYVN